MSIKGIYNSALYIGKQEVNILRKNGRKDTMSYSDMSEIELIISWKNNGIMTFKSDREKDIKFGFLKKSLDGIERAISYINDKAPEIPVVRKTQESFLFEEKLKRKKIVVSLLCTTTVLLLSAVLILLKPKNIKTEVIETSAEVEYAEDTKYYNPALQSYSNTLSTGYYIVGIDIPTGTYTLQAKNGYGNIHTDDGSVNEIFDSIGRYKFASDSVDNIYLSAGTVLTISGGLEVSCGCSDADINRLSTREQPNDLKDIEIGYGWFTSGTDFASGTYDIEWIEGNGNIMSDFYEDDMSYINEIMGDLNDIIGQEVLESCANQIDEFNELIDYKASVRNMGDHYIKSFKNLYLPEGVMLKIDEIKIKLSPSK